MAMMRVLQYRKKRRAAVLTACALASVSVFPLHSSAISSSASLGEVVSLGRVTDYIAQPLAILAKFPDAGPALSNLVATIFTQEPRGVDAILSIVSDTTPQQASAIGAGLVRGLRAMGGKDKDLARDVTEKVMRSQNLWLKTTFLAIGPTRIPALSLPQNVPAPPLRAYNVGDESLAEEWHLGATEKESVPVVLSRDQWARESAEKPAPFELQGAYGTIVAILASDAAANGAVSTSPTN